MAKRFLILMAGAAATIVAVTGCTQSAPTASAPQQSPTEETTATESTTPSQAEFRVVNNLTLPGPGADPLAMIVSLRQGAPEPIGSEQIRVTYPSEDKAVVTLTRSGLPDDSVRAIRTRYELAPEGGANGERLWKITQVTEQNRCQAGRGSEDWTGDLCS